MERIVVRNTQSPGDYVVLTAALRDIDSQYPGRFCFAADTHQDDVFRHNPHVQLGSKTGRRVVAKYSTPGNPYQIHKSNSNGNHFMWGFLGDLNLALGTHAVLGAFRPDIYVSEEEKARPVLNLDRPYWVFVSGGKKDFTAKIWATSMWQETIDRLSRDFTMVQVGGGGHAHPRINGAYDLTGKTSFRELMRLIYHSQGVVCIVTCLMHIAAGYNKPCVVVAGGREPKTWEAYDEENRLFNMRIGNPGWNPPPGDDFVPHRYLHTMGGLDCCMKTACWKSKVIGGNLSCKYPVSVGNERIPKCLSLISPEDVSSAVLSYYKDGIAVTGRRIVATVPETKTPTERATAERGPVVAPGKATIAWTKARVLLYSEGASPGYVQAVESFFPPGSVSTSKGESRSEFLRKSLERCEEKRLLWFEYPLIPVPGFLEWHVSLPSVGGIACWKRVDSVQESLIKSAAWYRGNGPKRHKLDGVPYVAYPRKGFFAADKDLLKDLNWPDERSEKDLEILFGAALEQRGAVLTDGGRVVEEYALERA